MLAAVAFESFVHWCNLFMLCYPLYTGITGTCKVTNAPTCAVLHHDHCRVRPSKLSWPRPGPRRSGWLLRNFGKVQSHVHIAAAVAEPHWCLPSSPWMNRMNFEPSTVCIGFVCEKKSGFVWKWGYPKMDGLYWKILQYGWFGWSQF